MIAIGSFSLLEAFKGVYLDIGVLSISLIFLLAAAACFYTVFKKRLYIFSKEKEQFIFRKGNKTRVYPFKDIIGYYEYATNYRYNRNKGLFIKTRTKTFDISSESYLGMAIA